MRLCLSKVWNDLLVWFRTDSFIAFQFLKTEPFFFLSLNATERQTIFQVICSRVRRRCSIRGNPTRRVCACCSNTNERFPTVRVDTPRFIFVLWMLCSLSMLAFTMWSYVERWQPEPGQRVSPWCKYRLIQHAQQLPGMTIYPYGGPQSKLSLKCTKVHVYVRLCGITRAWTCYATETHIHVFSFHWILL